MNILLIIGQDIDVNSNTNIFKRRLIKELSKKNKVTVLMDYNCNRLKLKSKIEIRDNVKYISYPMDFRVITFFKHLINKKKKNKNAYHIENIGINHQNGHKLFERYIEIVHPIYRYNSKWLKRAFKFKSTEKFDLVISMSHPPVSHQLAFDLIENNHIFCSTWIQLWFEYWYQKPKINSETKLINAYEKKLLSKADHIFYSNKVLSDHYSIKYNSLSNKIHYFDLPSEPIDLYKQLNSAIEFTIGYFGTYDSKIRNIHPLYSAFCKLGNKSYIVGPSDLQLHSKKNLEIINNRIPLKECNNLENKCHCLVILSNYHNNMISGKLYTYGMNGKPILFILDGKEEDQKNIVNEFEKYNNLYFCKNNEQDIINKINIIKEDLLKGMKYTLIDQFKTENVIESILNEVK